MPIYEYKCTCCHKVIEILFKSSNDEKLALCSKCGAPATRIISHTDFRLNGSGWGSDGYQPTNSMSDPKNALK